MRTNVENMFLSRPRAGHLLRQESPGGTWASRDSETPLSRLTSREQANEPLLGASVCRVVGRHGRETRARPRPLGYRK